MACSHTWSSTLSSSMGFTTFSATIARTVSPATYSALSHCTCRPVAADQPAPMMARCGAGRCGERRRQAGRHVPGAPGSAEGGAGPGQQCNDSRGSSNVGCCGRQACASTTPVQRIREGRRCAQPAWTRIGWVYMSAQMGVMQRNSHAKPRARHPTLPPPPLGRMHAHAGPSAALASCDCCGIALQDTQHARTTMHRSK